MESEPTPHLPAALERVVREQRSALAALARREGLAAEDALDCVHDAFCTFLQLAAREQLPPDPVEHGPFLAGIVRNAARNKRRRHHLALAHGSLDESAPAEGDTNAQSRIERAEDCARLRGCVDQLASAQRTVVMMRLLEERPGDDVASTLGLTRGHVDVLLHRAKASLLVCMAREL